MKQDVSSHETVNELAKKVLELYDVIDKQNDYIKKYQIALEIASVDIVKPSKNALRSVVSAQNESFVKHTDMTWPFLIVEMCS